MPFNQMHFIAATCIRITNRFFAFGLADGFSVARSLSALAGALMLEMQCAKDLDHPRRISCAIYMCIMRGEVRRGQSHRKNIGRYRTGEEDLSGEYILWSGRCCWPFFFFLFLLCAERRIFSLHLRSATDLNRALGLFSIFNRW